MSNMIEKARESINGLLNAAAAKAAANGQLPAGAVLRGTVEIPKDTANGDYAANHAMAGAKALRMAPRKIAEALIANIDLGGSWFSSVEVAGPGFINFRLADSWYADVLKDVVSEGEDYGRVDVGHGRKLMVEFVSANPTGPMHMGNARGGVLGDALASVLDRAGYKVWREFYVNDAGNQIEKFATSIDARYRQLILGEEAVAFPEDGYHGDDIKELARLFREENGDAYLDKPEAERHKAMADFGLQRNIPKMQSDLLRYGVSYDKWFFESELHNTGYVRETVQALTDRGYTYEKDGALWLATSRILAGNLRRAGKTQEDIDKLDLKDDVLCRANGFYTYFAADIAYHRNKLEKRGFDIAVNVWGADHHGHVARLKGALDALGLDGEHRLDIVLMQLVKLMSNGQEVRMSKRTGKAISLTNLLDDIPVDSARYFFNSRPETPVLFDLELAERQDNENPVYYVQYAHARICTLVSALAAEGHAVPALDAVDASVLTDPSERELIKQLAGLPEEIRLAARDYDPSRINKYVSELAARFHRFYTVCRIKDAQPGVLEARLLLADCVRRVIAVSLGIIGVSAPEKM
ncbi:MAG: arginine--tRNA ligase [Candidatus Limivicinus sp.]|nr:arginine--tRNA ligase [Clostridiales bacterium]MDY3859678.1 arginine--tRNA ligase [Candidatus Limivicinus sp.]